MLRVNVINKCNKYYKKNVGMPQSDIYFYIYIINI